MINTARLQEQDALIAVGHRIRVVYPDDHYDAEVLSRSDDSVTLRFLEDDEVETHKLSSLTYELLTPPPSTTASSAVSSRRGSAEKEEGGNERGDTSKAGLAANIIASATAPSDGGSGRSAEADERARKVDAALAAARAASPQHGKSSAHTNGDGKPPPSAFSPGGPASGLSTRSSGSQKKKAPPSAAASPTLPTAEEVARRRAAAYAEERKFREAHPECTFSPKLSAPPPMSLGQGRENDARYTLDFVERQRIEAEEREKRMTERATEAAHALAEENNGHRFEMSARSRRLVEKMGIEHVQRVDDDDEVDLQEEEREAAVARLDRGRSVRTRRHGRAVAQATAEARARSERGDIEYAADGTPLSPRTHRPLFMPSTVHPTHGNLFTPSWSAAEDRHDVGVSNGDICESLYRASLKQRERRTDAVAADTAVLRTLAQRRKMLPQSELLVARRFVEQAKMAFDECVAVAKESKRAAAEERGEDVPAASVFASMMLDEQTGTMVPRPESISFADLAAVLIRVGLMLVEDVDVERRGSGDGDGEVAKTRRRSIQEREHAARRARFYAHQRRLLLRLWAALAPSHPDANDSGGGLQFGGGSDPADEVAMSGGAGQGVELEPLVAFVEAVVLHRHEDENGKAAGRSAEVDGAEIRWTALLSAFWKVHQRALRERLTEHTAATAPEGVLLEGTVSTATVAAYADVTFTPEMNPGACAEVRKQNDVHHFVSHALPPLLALSLSLSLSLSLRRSLGATGTDPSAAPRYGRAESQ